MKLSNLGIKADRFYWVALIIALVIAFSNPLLALFCAAAAVVVSSQKNIPTVVAPLLIAVGIVISSAWWVLVALVVGIYFIHRGISHAFTFALWLLALAFVCEGSVSAFVAFGVLTAVEFQTGFISTKIRSLHK